LFLAGSLAAIAACSSTQRIDLCRRGDRVELAAFQLTALDSAGALLDQWTVPADQATTGDELLPDGTRRLRAEGLDGSGVVIATGETEVTDPEAICICVSTTTQHEIACRGVACRISDDRCVFAGENGAPLGTATFSVGDNASDDIRGVTADTYLTAESARQMHNFGVDPVVHVGSDPSAPRVGLWQFDLRAIPSTAQIVSATLVLTTFDNSTDAALEFFAVLEAWNEGLGQDAIGCSSWTCRSPGQSWAVPGAGPPTSSSAAPLMSMFPNLVNTPFEASSEALRLLVQQWVATPGDNHGITGRIASTSNASLALSSKEGADGVRPALRLELSIPVEPR
jgi:hypothetical protein